MALFDGYTKAYGLYVVRRQNEGSGKMEGKAETKRGEPNAQLFSGHLSGTGPGLGIIMLRDDDTVMFGAIDLDKYKHNPDAHARAEQAVKRLKLPLVVCRSKSGGIHFYCFTERPVAATVMRERLAEWTSMLGLAADTEQFPKQAARFNDNDIGSWINLPYFNAGATERFAVVEGQPASLSLFLDTAEAQRVASEDLEKSWIDQDEADALFNEGPPCLQMIAAQGGFGEGSRNNGMQAVVVYLKRRHPDNWDTKVDGYNTAMAGLPSAEVQEIVKHNKRKDYNYSCKQPPINAFCQRRKCLTRMYGVGEGTPEARGYELSAFIRYDSPLGDEPMWSFEVNGKRVMVTNTQLYSRDELNRAAMAQANIVPIHMPPQRWLRYLSDVIQTADIVMMPDDAGPTGQLWEWVENFCLQQVNALTWEEVWLGKPYRENGKVYFRSHDLFRYLDARRVDYKSEQAVWHLLREKGGDTLGKKIAGRFVNLWFLPMPEAIQLTQDDEVENEELDFTVTKRRVKVEEF